MNSSPAHHWWFYIFYVAGAAFFYSDVILIGLALIALFVKWERAFFVRLNSPVCCVFMVATSICFGAYVWEAAVALAGSNPYERFLFIHNRMLGPYAYVYWSYITFMLTPKAFWWSRVRGGPLPTLLIASLSLLPNAIDRLAVDITRYF
jgi:hypothetical protein